MWQVVNPHRPIEAGSQPTQAGRDRSPKPAKKMYFPKKTFGLNQPKRRIKKKKKSSCIVKLKDANVKWTVHGSLTARLSDLLVI